MEQFIDTPVKRYSSGMYLRLAFAVAAHLEPEILVVDEVLAVGDAEFQRKCLGKMSDVAQQGRTVLFVSHNMSAILRLTEETIVLDQRPAGAAAPPLPRRWIITWPPGFPRPASAPGAEMRSPPMRPPSARWPCACATPAGRSVDTLRSVEPITVEFEYVLDAPLTGLRVGVYLMTMRGEYVFASFDTDDPEVVRALPHPAGRALPQPLSPCRPLLE